VTEINADAWVSSGHRPMGFPEFVVVIASIMALNPIAMDMMLPALPDIASTFHITVANRPQMVLSIFLLGFGVGQFVMGPVSDRFGRRLPLMAGFAVFTLATVGCALAPTLPALAVFRLIAAVGTMSTFAISVTAKIVSRTPNAPSTHGFCSQAPRLCPTSAAAMPSAV